VSFDAIAPWYRTLETIAFGNALQRARVACLAEIQAPRRALIVGEGNGRFLEELLRTHPAVQVNCVDASEQMLRLARERVQRKFPEQIDRVRFHQSDITSWMPDERDYDLIVTHFVLDCFPEAILSRVIDRLAGAAKAKAEWLVADFCLPQSGFVRLRARAWLAVMYRFFRLTARIEANELVDPAPFLQSAGFVLSSQHFFRGGLLKSQWWERKWRCHPEPRRRRGTSQPQEKSRGSAFAIHEDRTPELATAVMGDNGAPGRSLGALRQPRDDLPRG
jgi:ubiquinone/menaquinone biosynthesis C-methylase UbiE